MFKWDLQIPARPQKYSCHKFCPAGAAARRRGSAQPRPTPRRRRSRSRQTRAEERQELEHHPRVTSNVDVNAVHRRRRPRRVVWLGRQVVDGLPGFHRHGAEAGFFEPGPDELDPGSANFLPDPVQLVPPEGGPVDQPDGQEADRKFRTLRSGKPEPRFVFRFRFRERQGKVFPV